MLTLDEIRNRLRESHSKINKVAEGAGLHPNAVYRLMKDGSRPSYDTVKKLSDYMEKENERQQVGS